MRILVAGLGTPGHTFPLIPLALALDAAGHGVALATGPEVDEAVATTGLDVVGAGGTIRDAFGPAMARHGLTERPTDGTLVQNLANEVFGRDLPRVVAADLAPVIEQRRPDLVVAETGDPGAALAARRAGVPCVTHSFGRRPPARIALSGRATAEIVEVATELGVTDLAVGDPLGHAYLDLCPPSMQAPAVGDEGPELALRPTAWNPPVPGFVAPRGDRPWVLLTLGTAMGDAAVLRRAVEGLVPEGVDILLAAGSVDAAELVDVARGPAVRVGAFVPQADLLAGRLGPPPVLVVHHGGSGTTLAASAAGIPQLVLPQGADQFSNAEVVDHLGVGRSLVGPAATPEAVAEAAARLTAGDATRSRAAALAAEVAAMPSPDDVAARVETWGVRS